MAPFDGSSPEAQELIKPKKEPKYVGFDVASGPDSQVLGIVKGPKGEELVSVSDFKAGYTIIDDIGSFPDIKQSIEAMQLLSKMKEQVYTEIFVGLPGFTKGRWSSTPRDTQDHRKEADATIKDRLARKRIPVSKETGILHYAILILERPNSWCQGTVEDKMGRVCMMGAMQKASMTKDVLAKLCIETGRQASNRYGGHWKLGHHFNDDYMTNKSMVLHVLLDTFESLGGRYEA